MTPSQAIKPARRIVKVDVWQSSKSSQVSTKPRFTTPHAIGYHPPASKEVESKNSKNQRMTAPDSTAVFLRPDSVMRPGGRRIQHPKGEEVRSAGSEFLTSRPPCRMRVRTYLRGFVSLNQERSMQASVQAIAPTLAIVDGIPTTTSVDVARHFGKAHQEVLRRIRNLLEQLPADYLRNFAETETERPSPLNGAPIKSPAYRITRDGFTLLAMGFTGKKALQFKLAYIDAFNRMEAQLTQRGPALVITQKPSEAQVAGAMGMGHAIAGHVQQSVAMAVLRGGDDWKHKRYMLTFITDSKKASQPVVEVLPADAQVMTQDALSKLMADAAVTAWHNVLGNIKNGASK